LSFTWLGDSAYSTLNGTSYGSNIFEVSTHNILVNYANVAAVGGTNKLQYSLGSGQTDVYLNGGAGEIDFGAGISAQDVYWQANNWGDLSLKVRNDTTDNIMVHSDLTAHGDGTVTSAINELRFSDGSIVHLEQTSSQASPLTFTWLGDSAYNTLNGSSYGSNVFEITTHNISVNFADAASVGGTNTVKYDLGSGPSDVYLNGATGSIALGADISPDDVLLQASGSDLIVRLGTSSDYLTIHNDLSTQSGGTYSVISQIAFSDGTIWDRSDIASNAWVRGTAGGDSITVPSDAATVDAGQGDDYLSVSGNGSDRIVFAKGDGHDTLDDTSSGYQRNDTLDLTDIVSSEVLLTRSGDQLIVSVPSTGDTFTVRYQFYDGGTSVYGINAIKFADGTTWDHADIAANAWVRGTAGGDSITVPTDAATIAAGQGDDYLNAMGTGSDRILFAKGDGHDTLDNGNSGYQRNDTLDLTDTLSSEVLLTRSGNQLIVSVPSTGDTFTVLWQFYDGGTSVYGINNIKFSDGTIWNRSDIAANAWIRGTTGGDSISVPSDGVTVDAGHGDDYLSISGNGSDRIVFAKGDGHDTLSNPGSGYNRNDTLDLTDITASEVQFSRSGDALLLSVPSTGDAITVNYQFWGDGSQIQGVTNIKFADDTTWNRSEISDAVSTFTWTGSSTNSTLTGNDYGSNIFQFGDGSEVANGGARSNVFQVSASSDQAEINLSASAASRNELDFVGGITNDELWFVQSGDDLKIDLLGTSTEVSVANWFASGSHPLQEISAGGLKVDSQISQLVQAMATYSAGNPGFDPTVSSVHTIPNDNGLQTAVAAAWHS
jgi:hypothetical protein